MRTADLKPRKDLRGNWTMEAKETVNGVTWVITTMKRSSGNLSTFAQETNFCEDGVVSFDVFGSKNIRLVSQKVKVTEKAVRAQFLKALTVFEENKEIQEHARASDNELRIGRCFFFWSLESNEDLLAIYHIEKTKFGTQYHYVNLNTLGLGISDRIKPFEEKFGIGYYYRQNEFIEVEKLENIVIDAKEKQRKDKVSRDDENKRLEEQFNADVQKGRGMLNIPTWAKCVIVADLYQNDSDSMTDYFASSVQDTVFLGFSKSTRNNMRELKAHAVLFEDTKGFVEFGKFEQTSGGTYLPAYYLGSQLWNGWKVNKRKYFDLSNEINLNILFASVGQGKFLNAEFLNSSKEILQVSETMNTEGALVFDYSEKAFAIIGNTEPISKILKQLGGRYNKNLKCGEGWIFPKTKLELVKDNIKDLNLGEL